MKVKLSTLSITRILGAVINRARSLLGAAEPLLGCLDRLLVAFDALVGLHRRQHLLGQFVRYGPLELGLGLGDQRRRAHGIAGRDLVRLDDEEAAILGVGEHPAL